MSIRNLDALFQPESIALIGASGKQRSVGGAIARNLFHSGFAGPILPVHPEHRAVEGVLAYPDIDSLPFAPDLAVIATPPDSVPDLVRRLAERGTRAAVLIAAGFGEGGDAESARRLQAVLDAARPHTFRLVGPNCIGVMQPRLGLNASFAHIAPRDGDLAFVTQSGAMSTAMLDWATPRGIGFSHVVSLGDMADVDFGDVLDYLTNDPGTRAILLYIETVTHARKFMSAARMAARTKPVIVLKGGRFEESARAASSHTGALAGADAVFDAAFRRAGMLRVFTMHELFDAAETLSHGPRIKGDRMAILTNGGGLGILATDALIEGGGRLAELSDETLAALDAALPPTWSHGNPVDIVGDAPGARYAETLRTLMQAREVDAVLAMNCPVAVADPEEAALAVSEELAQRRRMPVFTAWMGEGAARNARRVFADSGIPSFDTPEAAVRGFLHIVRYKRNQEELMETPPSIAQDLEPDAATAETVVRRALESGRSWLPEVESKQVLAAYGLSVADTRAAAGPREARVAAEAIGYPVALKIVSPDIVHKSEVGGVELELEDADAVAYAAERMLRRVAERRPDARVEGLAVQRMIPRGQAHELIVGATTDPVFGPVMLFGEGGAAVEVLRDRSLALPPLNMVLARRMIEATRVHRLLRGYRDRPAADIDAVAAALIKLSQLIADRPEIVEAEVNPLLTGPTGAVALDARIRVAKPAGTGAERFAIRPYPKHLEQTAEARDGSALFLRPIRPEDEPALQAFFRKLSDQDVRMRYFSRLKELTHSFAARLTQIDYDREMALVATPPGDPGEILGVVRLICDPDNRTGEYAVEVRSDLKGKGVGLLLMQRILAYARARGVGEIVGDVLAENRGMLAICRKLGFDRRAAPDDPQIVRVRLPLGEAGKESERTR